MSRHFFSNVRNARRVATALAIILLLIIFASLVLTHARTVQGERISAVVKPPPELSPDTFQPTPAQWDSLVRARVSAQAFRSEIVTDGNIATNDNAAVNVFSPYSGRVAELPARLGDVVRKGDTLMAVDASEFVQGQSDLVAALAAVNTASTQAHLAEKTEHRQHELFLAKAGAQKDWLQSQSDLIAAQNAVRAAEVGLAAVKNRLRILGKSDAEIVALENPTSLAHAGTTAMVKAPLGGTVVQRQVGVGQYIQSAAGGAATPLFVIADLSSLWLIANLRETDAGNVKVGQSVEVKVSAFPDRLFKARLSWISPLVDSVTHRVQVRADIDNRDRALKPQMLASFTITTKNSSPTLAVPQSAVIYEGTHARLFVAKSNHTIQARAIEVGQQNADMIEVLSGLAAGESIVTGGALFIDRAIKSSGA